METTRSEDAEARRDDHATVVAVVREQLLGLRKEVTPRRRGRLPRTGRGSRLLPQVVERTRERDESARKVAYESQVHRYAFLLPRIGSRRCGAVMKVSGAACGGGGEDAGGGDGGAGTARPDGPPPSPSTHCSGHKKCSRLHSRLHSRVPRPAYPTPPHARAHR